MFFRFFLLFWKSPLNKQQVISLSDIFISPLEDMYVGKSKITFPRN
jgi:hypothetical protein